jgi:hypothetical protein
MKPTIIIDSRQWQKAAKELFETSSRSCVDFTNGQALRVASLAIKETEKANRVEIERIMGVLSSKQTIRGGKAGAKGWVRITKRKIGADSFAARIVAKRFRETGSWFGLKGKTLEQKALKLIAAKVKSVGFIKSGWIPSVQTLSAVVYQKPRGLSGSVSGSKIVGAKKGYAVPARFGFRSKIEAVIANTALNQSSKFSSWHGKKGNPMPVAEKGLQRALNLAAQDMIQKLAERLNPDFKKVSAK